MAWQRCQLLLLILVHTLGRESSATTPPLRGEWVRYRADFMDYAVGFNPRSNAAVDGAPAAIFFPSDTAEVQWFTESFHQQFSFSVRSGGHSYEGLSATPCTLTVNNEKLKGVDFVDTDPNRTLVRVGAGTRHGHLYELLALQHLSVAGASCMDVGFMGCTLGGCHGLLSAAYGLSSDNVNSFDIVLANSTALRVSATVHPELFWALRGGGGGDFGVVTAVQVEAHALRTVVIYSIIWDLETDETEANMAQLIRVWQRWAMDDLPSGTSATLKCTTSFNCVARGIQPGALTALIEAAVEKLLSRFTIPSVQPESAVWMDSYINAATAFSDCRLNGDVGHKVKSLYYPDAMSTASLQETVAAMSAGRDLEGSDWTGVTWSRVGRHSAPPGASLGTSSSPPSRRTSSDPMDTPASLFHRSAFLAELEASWQLAGGAEVAAGHRAWVEQLGAAMAPGSHGSYRNYEDVEAGEGGEGHPAARYYVDADALARLAAVKAKYDAEGAFKHALSSSDEPETLSEFFSACNASRWPAAPSAPEGQQTPPQVLLGFYAAEAHEEMMGGHLAQAAASLTHVAWDAVTPTAGGEVNVSEAAGEQLREFVREVRRSNARAKTLLSVGSPGNNQSAEFARIARSADERDTLASGVAWLLETYEVDGVNIAWYPGPEDRDSFVALLQRLREMMAPGRPLTLVASVSQARVAEAYLVEEVSALVDYVVLAAGPAAAADAREAALAKLTHLPGSLFSPNRLVPSQAAGVANWLEAGVPRQQLVLGLAAYGTAWDTIGEPPATAGRLDWRVTGPTSALTARSGQAGVAGWADIFEALSAPWSTWEREHVAALGGEAAWNEERGVWVGFDSPAAVKQKGEWVRAMGMAGGMVHPLHLDTFGPHKPSLVEAFLEELEIELSEYDSLPMMLAICIGIPGFFLCCCVAAQLRRWMALRKLHSNLVDVAAAAELWTETLPPASPQHDGASSTSPASPQFARTGSADVEAGAAPQDGRDRFQTARRNSAISMASAVGSVLSGLGSRVGSGVSRSRAGYRQYSGYRRSSLTGGRRGSVGGGRRGSIMSMTSVQSAFDGAMMRAASTEFDEHLMRQQINQSSVADAALARLSLPELSRKLALLKKAHPEHLRKLGLESSASTSEVPDEDTYRSQQGVVRYSRLLKSDAVEWLDNPEKDYLSFYETKKRGIVKLMIVITMYAETPDLLERSMRGVARGINELCTQSAFLRSWDEAVVCIVSDGLAKLDKDTAQWLELNGAYSPSLIEDAKKLDKALWGFEPDVALHCFEGLMQLEAGWCPLQTVLMIKQQNAGKLDSQAWAFTGMAERLMPLMPARLRGSARTCDEANSQGLPTFDELRAMDRYLCTVDAGTEPVGNSLVELIMPMRYDPKLAGTCGHMVPDKTLGNLMEMSQVFEYEYGHIIEKSMESMFGFITVLPGAYSGFRFDSIRRDQWYMGKYRRHGPLVDYFKQLTVPADSPALLNMGLAEDRWLCFALMTMPQRSHNLWYAPRAKAVTDVPDTLQSFLQQRRRWNNGAFFTRLHVMRNYLEMWYETGHSLQKKAGFVVQLLTMTFDTVFVWFAAAFFYLWIAYTAEKIGNRSWANAAGAWFLILYLLAVLAHYDRKVSDVKWVHQLIAVSLGLEIVFCLTIFAWDQSQSNNWQFTLLVLFGLASTLFCALLQGKFLKMSAMLVPYLVMYPTYAVLAQLYGFCHVHDVSWGTKGIETAHGGDSEAAAAEAAEKAKREEEVRLALSKFRFRILVFFISTNFTLGYIVDFMNLQQTVLLPLFVVIVFFNTVRVLGSVAYAIVSTLDDVLQLAAVGDASRDFGEGYERLQRQTLAINKADALAHLKVYRAFRRRGRLETRRRKEALRAELARAPEDAAEGSLSNLYEDDLQPGDLAEAPSASEEEAAAYSQVKSESGSTVLIGQIAFDNGILPDVGNHGVAGRSLGAGPVLPARNSDSGHPDRARWRVDAPQGPSGPGQSLRQREDCEEEPAQAPVMGEAAGGVQAAGDPAAPAAVAGGVTDSPKILRPPPGETFRALPLPAPELGALASATHGVDASPRREVVEDFEISRVDGDDQK